MWMRQQPSAPNAVAIVSLGKYESTAQRKMFCGVALRRSSVAAAIRCGSLSASMRFFSEAASCPSTSKFIVILIISSSAVEINDQDLAQPQVRKSDRD